MLPEAKRHQLDADLEEISHELTACNGKIAHEHVGEFIRELRHVGKDYPISAKFYAVRLKALLRAWNSERGILCVLKALEE